MPYTTLYGPEDFSAGDIDVSGTYGSTDQGGGGTTFNDPPMGAYPKIWFLEAIKRDEGVGPNGEDALVPYSVAQAFATSLGIVPGEIGSRKEFDVRPTADGPFTVEWDQYFSTTYWDDNVYAQLFWLGSDHNHGASQSGVIFGEDVVFIEMIQTSGYNFDWWTEHWEPSTSTNFFTGPDLGPFTSSFSVDNQWRTMKVVIVPGTTTGFPNGGQQNTLDVTSDGSIRLYSKLSSEPRSAFQLEFEILNKPIVINRNDNSLTEDGVNYAKGVNLANPTAVGGFTNVHAYWGTIDAPAVTVPPMQRASYVFFSNAITEKQVETRLSRSYLQLLVSDPDDAAPGIGTLTLTNITGTLLDQNGNIVTTGRLYITPRNFITVDSEFLIAPITVTYDITGPLDLDLAPSTNGVLYDVYFDPDPDDDAPSNLKLGYWRAIWNVPAVATVNISDL